MKKYLTVFFALAFFSFLGSCESGDDSSPSPPDKEKGDDSEIVVNPVSDLMAAETENPNELLLSWNNPSDEKLVRVEISYTLEGSDGQSPVVQQEKVSPGKKGTSLLKFSVYGKYLISATAIDNYGRRSVPVTITGTPSKTGFDWVSLADSCTFVLIEQFMNKKKGTFWISPKKLDSSAFNIYWQQAHAIDVLVYSYERIKDVDPQLAAIYCEYFDLWFKNKGNNYHHDPNDETGFLNPFTDDMCWICLTLIHFSEATGDDKFVEMARKVYDTHIIRRAWKDEKGTGLPWQSNEKGRNACTNAPGCLVAAKLYKKYSDEKYLADAKMLYDFIDVNMITKLGDGRVEEPPLTYTQGTFGEACRQLFHITNEEKYMRMSEKVIKYATTSKRCLQDGILREEGTSMDQSIFKAVFAPYAMNLALDADCSITTRTHLKSFLKENARRLRDSMDEKKWPEMYCNFFWGTPFTGEVASMGAQTSGASLMESVARMFLNENQ